MHDTSAGCRHEIVCVFSQYSRKFTGFLRSRRRFTPCWCCAWWQGRHCSERNDSLTPTALITW